MKGFTLIALLIIISIIGILAGSGAWLMSNTIKNSVFIPNQMNMDKLANDALDIMIEGDAQRNASGVVISGAAGLRFAKVISSIAANDLTFVSADSTSTTSISIRYRILSNQLLRTITITPPGTGTETVIPAYISSLASVTLSGKSGTLFTYYGADVGAGEPITATASSVRRVRMILIAKTGTGLYNDWEGQSEQATSVSIDRLQ